MPAEVVLSGAAITGRGRSLNPFVILDDAAGFIDFVGTVFGGEEVAHARTQTPSGSLIHAEVRLGDSWLLLSDRQEGWPPRPGMFQLWVGDLAAVLDRGTELGSVVVTPATPFYGQLTLARLHDRWGNLWWLYQPTPGQPDPTPIWKGGPGTVFRTLDEHLRAADG